MSQLVLRRASASRLSGEWSDDDYDVLAEDIVVGRIMKAAAAPVGQPWLWTLAYGHHEDRTPSTATSRRARLRCRRSLRAGTTGNSPALPLAWPLMRPASTLGDRRRRRQTSQENSGRTVCYH